MDNFVFVVGNKGEKRKLCDNVINFTWITDPIEARKSNSRSPTKESCTVVLQTQQKYRLPEKKRYFMPFSFGCIKHAVSILKSLINHSTFSTLITKRVIFCVQATNSSPNRWLMGVPRVGLKFISKYSS